MHMQVFLCLLCARVYIFLVLLIAMLVVMTCVIKDCAYYDYNMRQCNYDRKVQFVLDNVTSFRLCC